MKNSQYELAVQINGKPVKEYVKDGRVFVEAKSGSNYSLKIKNNSWGRILAVFSVDGIDVITGKSAADSETGYVISGYNNLEVKGFRVDDNKEASFKFFDKGRGKGYAEIRGDASAAGVIGVRIFAEKVKPAPVVIKEFVPVYVDRPFPVVYPSSPVWSRPRGTPDSYSFGDMTNYSSNIGGETTSTVDFMSFRGNLGTKSSVETKSSSETKGFADTTSVLRSYRLCAVSDEDETPKGFDMTTGWGSAVESKVTTVTFDKGILLCEMEIFYASRESLEQMGIKFDSIPEVAFPSAFDKKLNFCPTPVGWKG